MKNLLLSGLLIFPLLASCAAGTDETTTTPTTEAPATSEPASTPETTPEAEPTSQTIVGLVQSKDYSDWPFTVNEGIVNCLPGNVVVLTTEDAADAKSYPLNGNAQSPENIELWSLSPLDEIWKDNPEIPGTKLPINDFIDIGLSRCGG